MLGLDAYEQGVCECGFHKSLTGDKSNVFQMRTETCLVCAGAARERRVLDERDKKALEMLGRDPAPGARRSEDGRHLYMAQLSPGEVQELRDKRSATARRDSVDEPQGRRRNKNS